MNTKPLIPLLLVALLSIVGCTPSFSTSSTQPVDLDPDAVIDAPSATLHVQGMSCPLCANNIDRAVTRVAGVTSARLDLGRGTVSITLAPGSRVRHADLRKAIDDAGYTLQRIDVP